MLEMLCGVALISARLQYENDEGKAKRGVFNEKKGRRIYKEEPSQKKNENKLGLSCAKLSTI